MNEDENAHTCDEYSERSGLHHPNSDGAVASGSGVGKLEVPLQLNINYSIQTTNPNSHTGNVLQTLNIGEKLVHELTIPSNEANDQGGQSSKPLPKERKRKYDYDGPQLSDEEEEKKRQKAKRSSLWRKNNLRNDEGNRENTTIKIEIEPSLSTCYPQGQNAMVTVCQEVALEKEEVALEKEKVATEKEELERNKLKLLEYSSELYKQYPTMNASQYEAFMNSPKELLGMQVSNQDHVEHEQPEQENTHTEKGETSEPDNEVCKLQVKQRSLEIEKLKPDRKEWEQRNLETELEKKKVIEENKKLKENEHDKEDMERKYEQYKIVLEQQHECEKQKLEQLFEHDKNKLEQKYEKCVVDEMLQSEIVNLKQNLEKLEESYDVVKKEKEDLMKKQLEFYAKTFNVRHVVENYLTHD